jgi:hypothetical protein
VAYEVETPVPIRETFGQCDRRGQRPAPSAAPTIGLQLIEPAWPIVLEQSREGAICQNLPARLTAGAVVGFIIGIANALLLGLTATPERSDELDVLHWFGGRTSAEIRLLDAINRRLLCRLFYL